MRIAVASGKGGTGKTTVSVSLALSMHEQIPVQFVDCDVEEPNAHLFLKPTITETRSVFKQLPQIDKDLCDRCGECASACQFNAIAVIGKKVLVYNTLCHGCGLCSAVCPKNAIKETPHKLGQIKSGTTNSMQFSHGLLDLGEAMATPIIQQLLDRVNPQRLAVLDASPGTGCPAIATLQSSNVALLVTEPTPFGLHDLQAAVGVARSLDIPPAVVINRDGIGDNRVDKFCNNENIPIVLRIPFDRNIASAYSRGIALVTAHPSWSEKFVGLFETLGRIAQ